jgi:hypothetical protein
MKERTMRGFLAAVAAMTVLSGCGESRESSATKEAMDGQNDPRDVPGYGGAMTDVWARLPDQGQVSRAVWTGDYYPYSAGGLAKRVGGQPSALEKFDQATNGQGLAQRAELTLAQQLGGTSWAGHCNGLAAAGTMNAEPQHAVERQGVTFTPTDIKALLIGIWQDGGTIVGGRCNLQTVPVDATGRVTDASCRGVNPAAFHLALANFIGTEGKPLINDIQAGEEVWNYPITKYQVLRKTPLDAAGANQLVGHPGGATYAYDASATKFYWMQTRVQLATGHVKTYEYLLEGNDAGEITGGEWVGASREDHPDFIWRHTRPNPKPEKHLDVAFIQALYEDSIR